MRDKLGIIQVRGIGDCIIVLPIARHYHELGYDVHVALDDRYCDGMRQAAPYCTFVEVPHTAFDPKLGIHNPYWYELPLQSLRGKGCKTVISFPYHECLILASTKDDKVRSALMHRVQGPFENRAFRLKLFSHTKFDEFKYATAKVPFENKWKLEIARNKEREEALFDKIVSKGRKYIALHCQGSDFGYDPKAFNFDQAGYDVVHVAEGITDNVFDWLTVFERADMIVALDSVFSNLVEQLNFANPKFFIRRSPVINTPVLKNNWDYVEV